MRMKLKLFRIKKRLSQDKFAEKLGYSRGQYRLIESGEQPISPKFLVAFVEVFGGTLEEAKELTEREE